MTDSEKRNFSEDLLKIFKSKNWLKERNEKGDDDWEP